MENAKGTLLGAVSLCGRKMLGARRKCGTESVGERQRGKGIHVC